MPSKVILIQSEVLGRGDDELGTKCMANFLKSLEGSQVKPEKLIFWNAGVRLLCEGSWSLGYLQRLEEQGVEILACTTCLKFFNLMDELKVGKPTTMLESVELMLHSDMVCL